MKALSLHVIGTAGHVDHGKTLLIEALTGINADRLPEEKRRGLTIDLGFAHFYTPEGDPIGVIDVPGHERFIRNMVAGAWSLDLAILTVAADDGWMQQSSDHTRVLRLMGVPRLIAAITKTDIVSPERVHQVSGQVVEECRRLGYPEVAAIAVSARTGRGIDELKKLILAMLEAEVTADTDTVKQQSPPLIHSGSTAHVYVDRVFTVKGSGVVVTGSLMGGVLERGQELVLLPQDQRVRIRSMQSYHKERDRVEPVSRVAMNLSGVSAGEIARGDLLSHPDTPFRKTTEFILRSAPTGNEEGLSSLKRDTEVEMAAGTGHRIVRLTRLSKGNLARIRLDKPIPLRWNQPIVLIRHGGSTILGGGSVLWVGTTSKRQRLVLAEIEADLPSRLELKHLGLVKLSLEGSVNPQEAGELGLRAAAQQSTVQLGDWIVQREHLVRLESRIRELAGQPGGVRIDELATKNTGQSGELLRLVAGRLTERGELSLRGGVLFPADARSPQVSPMGRQLLRDLHAGGSRGLQLSKLKVAGARKELRNLVRSDLAVALDGDIFYEKQVYVHLVSACLAGLEVGGTLSIADAKERTGLSRKYVIPLLNRMESDGYVKRSADERVVTALPG